MIYKGIEIIKDREGTEWKGGQIKKKDCTPYKVETWEY
jgi:hypothetical protein